MLRHEAIAEALETFPASLWGEPASRSWDPDKQAECIDTYRHTITHLQKIHKATATLIENEYPVRLSTTCIGASISVERKSGLHDPTITYTVNEGLLDAIEEYCALSSEYNYTDDIVILCMLEATAEYFNKRLIEEMDFLEHIIVEMPTETALSR